MGIGMVLVVGRDGVDAVRATITEASWVIGALDARPPGAEWTCLV
jgi:phosphoribosylaminoimidazole (AIR) synthetase